MKRILLSLAVIASSFLTYSQVIVAGISPANIAGNYDFTWADPGGGDWATPDFLIPGTFVQAELMMVDDGSTGTNAQGNPVSAEGCNPLINTLTGKIAVIYRNTCEFGAKAYNAQQAGAVGAIIINRDNEVIGMGGGADGGNVTIPVVMLSSNDGATLVTEMANGPVTVFMGNKTGLYANDLGSSISTALISKTYGTPALLAQNGTEFNFALGMRVYNYGNTDQTAVSVNATVTDPSGTVVYDNTQGPFSLLAVNGSSIDSIDIYAGETYAFPDFSLATYTNGRYTLTYTITDAGAADDYDADNVVTSDFVINNDVFSYGMLDANNLPVQDNGYRPSTNNATFSNCVVINDPNASRLGVEGLYFSASNNTTPLDGEEITIYAYKWDDVFTDLNDANLAFNSLTQVGFAYYYYPSDLQSETVYAPFDNQFLLTDNERYLFCAQTTNLDVFLGYDTKTQYVWNVDEYLQPIGPVENDGTYSALGFGADIIPAMGVKVFDASQIGVTELATVNGSAFPNPAQDNVTISIDGKGTANLTITDVTGKVAYNGAVALNNGNASVDVSSLETGMYIFNVVLENGQTSQFNVVKK